MILIDNSVYIGFGTKLRVICWHLFLDLVDRDD